MIGGIGMLSLLTALALATARLAWGSIAHYALIPIRNDRY